MNHTITTETQDPLLKYICILLTGLTHSAIIELVVLATTQVILTKVRDTHYIIAAHLTIGLLYNETKTHVKRS